MEPPNTEKCVIQKRHFAEQIARNAHKGSAVRYSLSSTQSWMAIIPMSDVPTEG